MNGKPYPVRIRNSEVDRQHREEARRRDRIRKAGWIGGSLLAACGLFTFFYLSESSPPGKAVPVMKDLTLVDSPSAPHTRYNSDPPTSGPHTPYRAEWGVHRQEIPREVLVKNLEAGGVVIYYSRDLAKQQVEMLEQLVKSFPQYVLLTPDTDAADPIILTAWGRIDRLQEFDEPRIKRFIETFAGTDNKS
jgi:hypothetical protein